MFSFVSWNHPGFAFNNFQRAAATTTTRHPENRDNTLRGDLLLLFHRWDKLIQNTEFWIIWEYQMQTATNQSHTAQCWELAPALVEICSCKRNILSRCVSSTITVRLFPNQRTQVTVRSVYVGGEDSLLSGRHLGFIFEKEDGCVVFVSALTQYQLITTRHAMVRM